jgi:peptide/nickel transport system permease protein
MSLLSAQRWWITRILVLPVHLALFATVAFFLVRVVPGDPVLATVDATQGLSPQQYQDAAAALGLDGSIWQQLGRFWSGVLHGDLGTSSVTGRPVAQEIWNRLPSTLELVTLGLGGAILFSLLLGVVVLTSRRAVVLRVVRQYAKMAGAIPDFCVGVLGIVLLYTVLHVVPAPLGRVDAGMSLPLVTGFPVLDSLLTFRFDALASQVAHLALPWFVLVLTYTPTIWRQLLLGLDEQAAAPPTLFRVASGATRTAVYASILRRACAGAVVMVGALFGGLVGGVVVLEQLFSLGGVGQFAIDSVDSVDFLALQGFLVAIAGVCLLAFLVVDLVNMLLDPRRRPGTGGTA